MWADEPGSGKNVKEEKTEEPGTLKNIKYGDDIKLVTNEIIITYYWNYRESNKKSSLY